MITARHLAAPAAILASTLLFAACVGAAAPSASAVPSNLPPGSASESPSASPSTVASSGALIEVRTEGGFIGPAAHIGTLPTVWVSGDGRILVPAPMTMQYPPRLVPSLTVRDVGTAGAAAIRKAIADAGLDTADYTDATPGMPDVGQWVIVVNVDGRTVTTRLNGLGVAGGPGGAGGTVLEGTPGGGPADSQIAQGPASSPTAPSSEPTTAPTDPLKAAASALIDRLTNPAETWGEATAPTESIYAPTGYRVWVSSGAPQADPALTQAPIAWPLATPLASFGTVAADDFGVAGLRVGTVTGADAALLAPVLERATAITPFTSGGASYTLRVRPLLPGEPVN